MTAAGRRDADADADADATRLLDSSHRTARERTNRGATTCARIARRIARAVAVAVDARASAAARVSVPHRQNARERWFRESYWNVKKPQLKISSRSIG